MMGRLENGLIVVADRVSFTISNTKHVTPDAPTAQHVWDHHKGNSILDYSDPEREEGKECDYCGTEGVVYQFPLFVLGTREIKEHKIDFLKLCKGDVLKCFSPIEETKVGGWNALTTGYVHCGRAFCSPAEITVELSPEMMEELYSS